MQFRAIVDQTGATTTGIAVPDHVLEALGSGRRPKVTVTFNGYTYHTTVGTHDGRPMLSVSSDVRAASGVRGDDAVDVTIELDTAPRVIEVPEELAAALAEDPGATSAFDALSNSRKQQLTQPVARARTPETRMRNVGKALGVLRGE